MSHGSPAFTLRRALAAGALALLAGSFASTAALRADDSPGGAPHRVHALTGGTVVPRPGVRLEGATVVLRDGVIAAVGTDVATPPDAIVWDARGLTIYAGLIEPYWREPLPEEGDGEDEEHASKAPRPGPALAGARHENERVRPERDVSLEALLGADERKGLREAGFTAALVVPARGVFRGQSALLSLDDRPARQRVVRAGVAQHVALEAGGWSGREYPTSLMGAIALVRQTLLDTEHHLAARHVYARAPLQERPETNRSLDALAPARAGDVPLCLEAKDTADMLRGLRVLKEFELTPWVVLGAADTHRWPHEVAAAGAPVVMSLNFPPTPRWDSPDEEPDVEHTALRRWWLAPADPGRLERDGVRLAFTGAGLPDRGVMRDKVRRAIERGLSPEGALAALTTAPAALLRAPQLGVIAPGAAAHLTVADGDLFAEGTRIVEVWIDGARHPLDLTPPTAAKVAGTWRLDLAELDPDAKPLELELEEKRGRLSAKLRREGQPDVSLGVQADELQRRRLVLVIPGTVFGRADPIVISGRVEGRLLRGTWSAGEQVGGAQGKLTSARRPREGGAATTGEDPEDPEAEPGTDGESAPAEEAPAVPDPRVASPALWPPLPEPAPQAVVVRNATVWTTGGQGVLEGAMLVCVAGRVTGVGYDLEVPPGALEIDAGGRHVTPGIVDCHSHAFIAGRVNEATNSCTAEVRVADVIDAETVDIYRQLAGGVTTSNLLHGSANAIGGQNAVVQLRWGAPAEDLLFAQAKPGIKFALGENPKRSNWGHDLPPRYPTSRMGVIESIRERFLAAREYRRELLAWREAADRDERIPPRLDLQLEALAEVLAGERLVHCHSYRQDEILAMLRLAEQLGFTVGTFQHVLEGYKVADELAAHGAGASTFSDWWAYKFEVYDAIPHNGALMHERRVLVSFNSDSAELARRLNHEAGKAVRYGGLPEPEALAFVTLNPARQLGLGERVGSLEPGKQADFVIWSGHPLAVTSLCEQTWIAGRRYYARSRDQAAHAAALAERERLLVAARAARHEPGADEAEAWKPSFGAGARADSHAGCVEEEGE